MKNFWWPLTAVVAVIVVVAVILFFDKKPVSSDLTTPTQANASQYRSAFTGSAASAKTGSGFTFELPANWGIMSASSSLADIPQNTTDVKAVSDSGVFAGSSVMVAPSANVYANAATGQVRVMFYQDEIAKQLIASNKAAKTTKPLQWASAKVATLGATRETNPAGISGSTVGATPYLTYFVDLGANGKKVESGQTARTMLITIYGKPSSSFTAGYQHLLSTFKFSS